MTKVIKKSAVARWLVLIIVSLTMMMGYVVAKEMSPLQYLLELPESLGGMGWSSTEFGLFAGSRGFFNVFFLMLFFGGVILDKMGVRFTGVLSCALMVVGTAINYYALQFIAPHGTGLALPASGFTIKEQVLVAALGFAVFGIGYEMCGITVSKVIVKWFTGGEMALAMGLQVSLARLGTALALSLSPVVAQKYSVPTPVLVGLVCVVLGLLIYVVYCVMDARRDRALAGDASAVAVAASDEGFHLRDLGSVVKNPGFVLITMLCLLYYSALYPFLDFATKLMITKYGVEPQFAGHIPAILPFGSIILTPLFGALYDHHGHGAWFMIVGTVMLTAVLVVFALPLGSSALAVVLMVVLGVAFSLLPAALWPSVPRIVPMKLLGSAYAIIYYIQNIGLMLTPLLIGHILDAHRTADTVDYNPAMWVFVAMGATAIVVAVLLLRADHRHNYGLEKPSMES